MLLVVTRTSATGTATSVRTGNNKTPGKLTRDVCWQHLLTHNLISFLNKSDVCTRKRARSAAEEKHFILKRTNVFIFITKRNILDTGTRTHTVEVWFLFSGLLVFPNNAPTVNFSISPVLWSLSHLKQSVQFDQLRSNSMFTRCNSIQSYCILQNSVLSYCLVMDISKPNRSFHCATFGLDFGLTVLSIFTCESCLLCQTFYSQHWKDI